MSKSKSVQQKIGKVRPPRVHLTYDVEVGNAVAQKSLPFVAGVIADLAPGGAASGTRVRDRSFVEIDEENFDDVMAAMRPTLKLSVPNRLGGDAANFNAEVSFSELEAFTPAGLAKAVPQLAQLLETRGRLNDLLAKLEGNDRLNDLLAEVVMDEGVRTKASVEVSGRHAAAADVPAGAQPHSDKPA